MAGGLAWCYQCDLARSEAGGLLADVVVPLGYAVRGEALAEDLWRYKSERAGAAEAAGRLREMLSAFLRGDADSAWRRDADSAWRRDADSAWRAAGMPAAGPSAVAVVPSGQGRLGAHPLTAIVRSCVDLPVIRLSVAPGVIHARGLTMDWLRVDGLAAGADVLVVDDTWVSGGSAQSAAVALKLAGANHVAIVVLGRHVNPGDPRLADFLAALAS